MTAQRGELGVETVRKLQENWDSYGAPPITEAALKAARHLINAEPFVCPASDGGLQLEWHGDGVDFEIAIGPNGRQVIE